jgi:hypothetical protein
VGSLLHDSDNDANFQRERSIWAFSARGLCSAADCDEKITSDSPKPYRTG